MIQEAQSERRAALALLARATAGELAEPLARHWPDLVARDLRPPQTGLVMLRGRAGGDGAAFNLGEATVSRAVVELETGERGFGHLLGRDLGKARQIALLDALWQREADRPRVGEALAAIARRLAAEKAKVAAETAATRVDFFTLVRGEAEP